MVNENLVRNLLAIVLHNDIMLMSLIVVMLTEHCDWCLATGK
jgi:hypothetical protein